MTIGQLLDLSLEPARRALSRVVARAQLRSAYRDLDIVNQQIKDAYAAQKYLHRRISTLESTVKELT